MAVKDYYRLLGVAREASGEEIKKTYRKMARAYHPDLNQDKPGCEERLKEINEAYQILGDERKRRLYDLASWNLNGRRIFYKKDPFDEMIEILKVRNHGGFGMKGFGNCKGIGFSKRGCRRRTWDSM